MAGLLTASRWLIYGDGSVRITLALPAGAIVYWCCRRGLLAKIRREAPVPPGDGAAPQ